MYKNHTNCISHAKKPLPYSIIILPLHSIVQRWCAHQFYKPLKNGNRPADLRPPPYRENTGREAETTMLIIHNLKAGWRNILKYKVQNTISVLCLSVGVICFAISLYFINVLWQNVEKKYFQDNRVECSIQVEGRNIWKAIDLSDIEKIKKLNSVEDVIYRCHALYTEFILKH